MNIWSRLGISVAAAAIFCIVVTELIRDKAYYETFKWHACAFLGFAGIVLFGLGLFINKRARLAHAAATSRNNLDNLETSDAPHEQPLFADLAFWGPILVSFGIIILFIPYKAKEVPVAARVAPAAVKPPEPAPTPEPPPPPPTPGEHKPVVFPPVKLNGIIYRPPNSAAVINGKSFFVGDYLDNARVVEINEKKVVLELNSHRQTFLVE